MWRKRYGSKTSVAAYVTKKPVSVFKYWQVTYLVNIWVTDTMFVILLLKHDTFSIAFKGYQNLDAMEMWQILRGLRFFCFDFIGWKRFLINQEKKELNVHRELFKFTSQLPSKLHFSASFSCFRQSFSLGHYPSIYQPLEGVHLLIFVQETFFGRGKTFRCQSA